MLTTAIIFLTSFALLLFGDEDVARDFANTLTDLYQDLKGGF